MNEINITLPQFSKEELAIADRLQSHPSEDVQSLAKAVLEVAASLGRAAAQLGELSRNWVATPNNSEGPYLPPLE